MIAHGESKLPSCCVGGSKMVLAANGAKASTWDDTQTYWEKWEGKITVWAQSPYNRVTRYGEEGSLCRRARIKKG